VPDHLGTLKHCTPFYWGLEVHKGNKIAAIFVGTCTVLKWSPPGAEREKEERKRKRVRRREKENNLRTRNK
jgi:hypothetical protein